MIFSLYEKYFSVLQLVDCSMFFYKLNFELGKDSEELVLENSTGYQIDVIPTRLFDSCSRSIPLFRVGFLEKITISEW